MQSVKVLQGDLCIAQDADRKAGYFVDLWHTPQNRMAHPMDCSGPSNGAATQVHRMESEASGIKLTCWNCRGLSSSRFYLKALTKEGLKFLVISEY